MSLWCHENLFGLVYGFCKTGHQQLAGEFVQYPTKPSYLINGKLEDVLSKTAFPCSILQENSHFPIVPFSYVFGWETEIEGFLS